MIAEDTSSPWKVLNDRLQHLESFLKGQAIHDESVNRMFDRSAIEKEEADRRLDEGHQLTYEETLELDEQKEKRQRAEELTRSTQPLARQQEAVGEILDSMLVKSSPQEGFIDSISIPTYSNKLLDGLMSLRSVEPQEYERTKKAIHNAAEDIGTSYVMQQFLKTLEAKEQAKSVSKNRAG